MLQELLAPKPDAEFLIAAKSVLGLPAKRGKLLNLLIFGKRTNKLALLHSYFDGDEGDRDPKSIDVQLHYVRRALQPHGIEIETVWGDGYRMTADAKAAVLALLGIEAKP